VYESPLPASYSPLQHLLASSAIGSIYQEAQAIKFNCSCISSFTDCSFLLTISISIVSYTSGFLILQLSFTSFSSSIVSCTSGLLRLQLFSTFFQVQRFFSDFNLFINIQVLNLSTSLSTKELASFDFQ
jgi:hypothetical protein